MVVFPNAKINIGLDVLRKRPDGYHDISTVMMPIPWRDILEIVPGKDNYDTLIVTGREICCPPEKNLIIKAVNEFRKYADIPAVDIYLHKVIPDGAGLGGGSADAAFALKAVNETFSQGCGNELLVEIASAIGADCPFFIYNRPMLCEGTGTTLSAFDLRLPESLTLVVVKPDVGVSTKAAYSGVAPSIPDISLQRRLSELDFEEWQRVVKNDFEHSVFPLHPIIAKIKNQLIENGAVYSSMSGSGSSVFAFYKGDIVADRIKSLFPNCDILVSRL